MMRKVKYYIDDFQWFKRFYGLSDTEMNHIFGNIKTFKAVLWIGGNHTMNKTELRSATIALRLNEHLSVAEAKIP